MSESHLATARAALLAEIRGLFLDHLAELDAPAVLFAALSVQRAEGNTAIGTAIDPADRDEASWRAFAILAGTIDDGNCPICRYIVRKLG